MSFSLTTKLEPSAEAAWRTTLADLYERGEQLDGKRPSRELLGYSVVIEDPRRRLIDNSVRPLSLIAGVARFVWMMAGNGRIADISFYEPRVNWFTDDSLSVPGSNYGARLRQSYAGADQVQGAIDRLRDGETEIAGPDGKLRRAANVIWRPEDAFRPSKDIPCAFGLFYFPRDGRLTTQLVMRSNNAVALLPFNIFEFTLLAEVVAAEAELDLGPFRVDAMSMHLYGEDEDRGRKILHSPGGSELQMPPIQVKSNPLQQLNLLAQREADLRHQQHTLAEESLEQALARGEGLDSYWRPFLDVLLACALGKVGRLDEAYEVADRLPDYFSHQVKLDLEARFKDAEPSTGTEPAATTLFPMPVSGEEVASAYRDGAMDTDRLHALLDEIERSEEIRLTHQQADEVARKLAEERVEVAARSPKGRGDAEDFKALDRAEVLEAIRGLGFDR
jgi:hypothetical protein